MEQMDFVERDEDRPTTSPRRRRQRSPRSNPAREGYRRLTADIPADLHKRLKLQALQEECTVTDIIIEASRAWLANRRRG